MPMGMEGHCAGHPQDAVEFGHELIGHGGARQIAITLPAWPALARKVLRFKIGIERHEGRADPANALGHLAQGRLRGREMQGLALGIQLDLPVFGQRQAVSRTGAKAGSQIVQQHDGHVVR